MTCERDAIHPWVDIGYAASVTPTPGCDGFVVDVRVVEILGELADGSFLFCGENNAANPAESFEAAPTYLSGSIKWDGCSNLQFDEQESCMLHFCSRKGASNVGVLLERLYDLAREAMPKHAAYLQ